MKKLYLYIFLFVISSSTFTQEFSSFEAEDFEKDKNYGGFNYYQIMLHKGAHPTGTNYLQEIFSGGYWAATFRIGAQATGRKEWQRLHNYPQYGLGFAYFDLGGPKADSAIGSPAALYFFIGLPWARFGRFSINTDLELGLSYDFKPYDEIENPYQDVIGASTNLHFGLGLIFYYELSDRVDLCAGLELYHFSNGRMFTPQKGINLAGLNLGLAYHFNPMKNYTKLTDPDYQPPLRPEFVRAEKPAFKSHHEFQFLASIASVQAEPGEAKDEYGERDTTGAKGPRYAASTIAIDYAYQVARKIKLNTGFDLFYDGSVEYLYNDILPQDVKFSQKTFAGYHVGFQYLIERFAFVYNLGWYIYKDFEQRGTWYQRAGGRIGITDNLDVHIALKTRNGGIADWIEWGIVYKLKVN